MKQNVRTASRSHSNRSLTRPQPGRRPSCPTCRAKLTSDILVVPNYSLQHTIEKYVAALAATGIVDWQPTGARYLERQRRQK